MPISQGDQLFVLVKSLSKAEKRSFSAYTSRLQDADTLLYVKLFDLIDKQENLDEDLLIKKLKIADKIKFSNLKRHLYKQIMSSLRIIQISKRTDIQVREYLDFADILYGKGLVIQSLKILQKAKALAKKSNNDILYLSILENEKTIESLHITRSGPDNALNLVDESAEVAEVVSNTTRLSNIRTILHSHYVKFGHLKNEEEAASFVTQYAWLHKYSEKADLGYEEQAYLYQALVWYTYIMLDFEKCLIYAEKWVENFKKSKEQIESDPDHFMRGYHYLLTCASYVNNRKVFNYYLKELESFRKDNYLSFNTNTQIISFLYVHHGRLTKYILEENYSEGIKVLQSTLKRIHRYRAKLDSHRILVFYFKIAWIYLMNGDHDVAIKYLHQILNMEMGALREDIQGYSQLMFLMAHYDAGSDDIMMYLINNTKNFYSKMSRVNKLQSRTIEFFITLMKTPQYERKDIMASFHDELLELGKDPYERRSLLYLDIPAWLRQKMKRPLVINDLC
jgi:tetratricopeptide (TPR) repeat protein